MRMPALPNLLTPRPLWCWAPAFRKDRDMEDHIMQFFACDHLPPHLREVSERFRDAARYVVDTLPRNPERTVALRKLLEAKDAAVRAMVAK